MNLLKDKIASTKKILFLTNNNNNNTRQCITLMCTLWISSISIGEGVANFSELTWHDPSWSWCGHCLVLTTTLCLCVVSSKSTVEFCFFLMFQLGHFAFLHLDPGDESYCHGCSGTTAGLWRCQCGTFCFKWVDCT